MTWFTIFSASFTGTTFALWSFSLAKGARYRQRVRELEEAEAAKQQVDMPTDFALEEMVTAQNDPTRTV